MLEPWLRNTHLDLDPLRRAVVHALELAREDAARWTGPLTEAELFAQPAGLPSLAFQLRHIGRSLDRLLTYAEGHPLTHAQLTALAQEQEPGTAASVQAEFAAALSAAIDRIRTLPPAAFAETRAVGRAALPTTVAGLLVHCADHTQRHTGQLVTTAKLLANRRPQDFLSSP